MGGFLLEIARGILSILSYAIIANAILSWLVAFDVINLRHPVARQIYHFLDAITTPILAPFRRFIPPFGGVDVTPILALLVIQAAQNYLLGWLFAPLINVLGG